MAKRISEKDIFQGDIFANARKSATEYIKMLEALQGELKEMLAINKKIVEQSASQIKTTDALKKRAKAIKEVTEASKSMEVVEREKVKTQRELTKLESDNERLLQTKNRTLIQQRKEEERLAKIKARNLKIAKQEGQAYSKMSKRLNELRNRYKNLAVQNKENSVEGRKLLKTIQTLDAKLKSVDKSVGQSQRNVGNYKSAWGKLGGTLRNVASSFGLVGGVMGAVQLVKSSFNVITDFDSAIANLGAISGASAMELSILEDNAKSLGESTKFTASEVAGLSLELAKLGFTTDEIIQSTESILALASATGTELADASFIAGSTLRAFNLEATEMDRVASVLGVATTKSALNMEFLGTAMSKVAPVSSALGFSIEDTSALLGTLANAGFDASSSATATRNILLNLADSSGDLAQALGRPIKNIDDLAPALAELEKKGIDVGEALELTDKRSVSAFKTFLNNTDTMIGLRDSITDVSDELQEMSDKQLDTVNGQLALLNSKWQGMILGTSESAGAVEKIKNAIKFLTDNMETFMKVIGKVVKWFVIYKGVMIATNLATSIYNGLMVTAKFVSIAFSRGLRVATRSMKMFNVATKSNPIGLFAGLIATAIASLDLFGDSVEDATGSIDMLTESYAKLRKQQEETFKGIDDDSKQRIAEIDLEIAKLEQKNAKEEDILKLKEERLDIELADIQKKSKFLQDAIKNDTDVIETEGRIISDFALGFSGTQGFNLTYEQSIKRMKALEEARKEAVKLAMKTRSENEALLTTLNKQLKLAMTKNQTAKIGLNNDVKQNKKTITQKKIINIFEKERLKLIKERGKLEEEIRKTEVEGEIQTIQSKIDAELKARQNESESLEFIKEGNEVDLKLYNQLLEDKQNLQNKQVRESTEFAITQAEKEQEEFLKFLDTNVEAQKLTDAERTVLIFESEKNLQNKIDLLRIEENNKYKDIQQEKVDATQDANDEILESTTDTQEKINDVERQQLKERLDAFKDFTNQIIQQMDKRTDAQIKAIDEELAVSEKREDELRRLAEKGTTTAEQSLAVEQKRQAELERQKEELEKKKLRRQAILSGLDLLSSKIDNNEGDAVASTIRDITSLIAVIGNLPAFAEGTEFVNRGNAPKGTDQIVARVDEGERILTKDQNKRIGKMSNEQLTSMAQHWDDVDWVQPKLQKLHDPFQSSSMILSKFDDLQKTIENKPMLTEVRWDEVSQMIVEKVETKHRIENRHKSSKGIF